MSLDKKPPFPSGEGKPAAGRSGERSAKRLTGGDSAPLPFRGGAGEEAAPLPFRGGEACRRQAGGEVSPPLESTIPEEIFRSEVRAWAQRIGVQPQLVTLRPMKRKWASCSSKGNLTFDTDLLRQPAQFRREAIIHELLHLKYPNHGKMFRSLERYYLQDSGGLHPSGHHA